MNATLKVANPSSSPKAAQSRRCSPRVSRMRLGRLLVPIDFSDESKKALQYAGAFARHFDASITLLHVVEPVICSADYGYGPVTNCLPNQALLRKARARLNVMAQRLTGSASKPATVVCSGVADVEIPRLAKDLEADLILLGTRGQSGSERTPPGSTAEKVVRHAPCPVFVVRKKEHEFVWPGKSRQSP